VIASDRQAVKVGTALLVVDGTDQVMCRKVEFSLRPSRGQKHALEHGLLPLSVDSYNASLQHRRDAWRRAKVTVTSFEQFGEIKDIGADLRPDIARFGVQPVRSAIRRVDEAMSAFFRRAKDGQTPGYPRFKSRRRFRTVFYDEPVSWALRLHGSRPFLRVQGIGEMVLSNSAVRQLRRLADRGGEARTLTITKTHGGWRATVGFRHVATKHLEPSAEIGGVDRGITVTAALPDGTLLEMPKFLKQARYFIAELQRQRDGHEKFSPAWNGVNRKIAKAYRKARHQTGNWARHTAREIVGRYGVIALERLDLKNMTASAKGTVANPGRNVKAKSGLNRSLRDNALGRLAFWICVKAEEAGRRVWKVKAANSSRQCAACGHTHAANRKGTRFWCKACGYRAHADVNASGAYGQRRNSRRTVARLWQPPQPPSQTQTIPPHSRPTIHQPRGRAGSSSNNQRRMNRLGYFAPSP
jgi:putative transposase